MWFIKYFGIVYNDMFVDGMIVVYVVVFEGYLECMVFFLSFVGCSVLVWDRIVNIFLYYGMKVDLRFKLFVK